MGDEMTEPLMESDARSQSISHVLSDNLQYADESKTLKYMHRSIMLYLNSTELLIHDVKAPNRNISVSIADIIGAKVEPKKKNTYFMLHVHVFAKDAPGCCGPADRVQRKHSVRFDNELICMNWKNAINCAAYDVPLAYVVNADQQHAVVPPPIRKFICVVNPFSGRVNVNDI
jgi:hypothetical protein